PLPLPLTAGTWPSAMSTVRCISSGWGRPVRLVTDQRYCLNLFGTSAARKPKNSGCITSSTHFLEAGGLSPVTAYFEHDGAGEPLSLSGHGFRLMRSSPLCVIFP